MSPDERALRAELRQEAAGLGRLAMRARIGGADVRHYELDQRYYQLHSEGHPAAYPTDEHDRIDRELGYDARAEDPLARWPVGALHEQMARAEQRWAEQIFVDSLKATRESLVYNRDRDSGRDAGRSM